MVSREAHILKIVGSSPTAAKLKNNLGGIQLSDCGKTISIEIQHIIIGAIITATMSIAGFFAVELYGLKASNATITKMVEDQEKGFSSLASLPSDIAKLNTAVEGLIETVDDVENRVSILENDVLIIKLVQMEDLYDVRESKPQ